MNVRNGLRMPKIVLAHVIIASAGIVSLSAIVYASMVRPEMEGEVCLISLILIFITGLMAFMKSGLIVLPKNASAYEITELAIYNRFYIFILAVGAYYFYGKIGVLIAYPIVSTFGMGLIFYISIAIYTAIYIVLFVMVIMHVAIPLEIRFEGEEMTVYYKGKERRFKIKDTEISLLSASDISLFFPENKSNNSAIYIVSKKDGEKEELLISMPDSKEFREFWRYLYYRLNPNEYIKSEIGRGSVKMM